LQGWEDECVGYFHCVSAHEIRSHSIELGALLLQENRALLGEDECDGSERDEDRVDAEEKEETGQGVPIDGVSVIRAEFAEEATHVNGKDDGLEQSGLYHHRIAEDILNIPTNQGCVSSAPSNIHLSFLKLALVAILNLRFDGFSEVTVVC
jgi:hypothetical protein